MILLSYKGVLSNGHTYPAFITWSKLIALLETIRLTSCYGRHVRKQLRLKMSKVLPYKSGKLALRKRSTLVLY